ncbi:MAG: hypothetical protein IPL71_03680 [Anaerolineales bacterium]|uniref:hypothetical protein n=1 Tax=Candidatus Villigracilis proximus TaxID=3140683 RepID=UPI003134ADFE|nr:hypothetical protein [Anaerolineales bacterium]
MKRLFSLIFLFSACQSSTTALPAAPTEISSTATVVSPTPAQLPTEVPPTPTREPLPPLPEGFVHAKGRDLVIGDRKPSSA